MSTGPAALDLHETCIAVMLIAGGLAGWRAWRFRRTLGEGPLRDPKSRARDRVGHRRAGWTAVVACVLAFATAAGVLTRMYARAEDSHRGAFAQSTDPAPAPGQVE